MLSVNAHGIPEVENPRNIVYIFLNHRETAFALRQHIINRIFKRHIPVNRKDIGPVGHNILRLFIAQGKNFSDHLCL